MRKTTKLFTLLALVAILVLILFSPRQLAAAPPRAEPEPWPEYDWECWQFPLVCKYPHILEAHMNRTRSN